MSKKIFEKKLDSTILGLEQTEKETLKAQLEEAKKKLKGGDSVFSGQKQETVHSGKTAKKVSFKRILWNLFISVVFHIPFKKDANITVARIRQIKRSLSELGIAFFDFKGKAVNSELALYFLDIYRGAKAVYEIFYNPKSEPIKDLYFQMVFEPLLKEDSKEALTELSKQSLEKIFYNNEIKNKREYLKEKQQFFIDYLRKNDVENLQFALLPFEQLVQLYMDFDFRSFFEMFGLFKDPILELSTSKIAPEKIYPYLKELAGLMKIFTEEKLMPELEKSLRYANYEIRSKGYSDPQDLIFVEYINKVLIMCKKMVRFEILDALLQYISMDQNETAQPVPPKKNIFTRYVNLVIAESLRTYNQIEDEKMREMLWKDIYGFFEIKNENELIYPGIYNERTRIYMESFDLKGMHYIKPVAVLLTFLKQYYEPIIRNTINRIVVKGTFVKPTEGDIFSALYYKLDEMITDFNDYLKAELAPSELAKKPVLEIILSGKELNSNDKKNIKDKLYWWDKEIEETLSSITQEFNQILNYFIKFREDFKNPYPEIVANLRSLRTEHGNSLYPLIEQVIKIIEHFFFIMRNFIVLKSDLNTVLKIR